MAFYPKLPDELKLMVWKESVTTNGAHHVKLLFNTVVPPISGPLTPVAVRPIADGDDDSSTWRERAQMAKVTAMAKAALTVGRHHRVLFRATRRRRVKTEENGIQIQVDGANDLVIFRIVLVARDERGRLRTEYPCLLFRDIHNVGFIPHHNAFQGFGKWNTLFDCTCPGLPHAGQRYCHHAIVDYMRLFPDLKTFNYVLPINKQELLGHDAESVRLCRRATNIEQYQALNPNFPPSYWHLRASRKGLPKPLNSEELTRLSIRRFRDLARGHDRVTYTDRNFYYVEVKKSDTGNLRKHEDIWFLVRKIQGAWKYISQLDPKGPGRDKRLAVKCKVLVFAYKKYLDDDEEAEQAGQAVVEEVDEDDDEMDVDDAGN